MKKIILFSYLLCCFNLFAFYYDSTGIQSSLDQEKEDNTNNPGNQMNDSPNNQEAFNEARKKESEITELGEKLDDLDNEALKLLEEIDLLDDKSNTLDINTIPELYIDDYLNSLMKETNKNKRKQELTDKLLAYKVNRYEADKIRKEITKKTEEINKILEPIVTQINNDKTAGDPVFVTTGEYVYEFADTVSKREYKYGRTGLFGKNWISFFDSRIIRCKLDDHSQLIGYYENLIKIYKDAKQEINKIREKYSDVTQFDDDFENYNNKIEKNKKCISLCVEINNTNEYVDELNKYVSYDLFENEDSYTIDYNYIIYVNDSGEPLYFCLKNGIYLPIDEEYSNFIKIYGRDKNGNQSYSGDDAGGFIVELPYGEKKYYTKYGQLEKIIYKNGQSKQFEYENGRLSKIVLESGENLTIKTGFDGKILSINGPIYGATNYEYKEGYLSYAKDSDQIPVSYKYNSQGYLDTITKADGSTIKIWYEYNSKLGTVVSKITNEIGEEEFFEYDFSNDGHRKTIYTSPSGKKTIYFSDENQRITSITNDENHTVYEYNDFGVYSAVTENGKKRTYYYDQQMQLSKISFDDGSEYRVFFDNMGNLIKEIDREGNIYEWTYDLKGNQLSSLYNGNLIYQCEYDSKSMLKKISDNRYQIDFKHNQFGNVLEKKTSFDGKTLVEKWNYDNQNRPIRYENTNGDFTIIEYKERYRKENHNNKVTIETFYNERMWEVKTIVTDLTTNTKYTKDLIYDSSKKLKKILIDGKLYCSCNYNPGGILKSYTVWSLLGNGYTTEYVYDSKNRIISEIVYEVDKGGFPIGEKFTLYSRKIEVLNEKSKYQKTIVKEFYGNQKNPRQLEYNSENRLVKLINPDGYVKTFEYSRTGKLLETSDSNNLNVNYVYNRDLSYSMISKRKNETQSVQRFNMFGNLVEYKTSGNYLYNFDYDSVGNLLQIDFNNGSKKITYDKKGRVTSQKVFDSSNNCIRLSEFLYNDKDNFVQTISNSKISKTEKYDALGRLIEVTNAFGNQKFEYDCLGNIIKMTDGSGCVTEFEYNPYGDVSKILKDGNLQQFEYYPTGDVKAIFYNGKQIASYQYDKAFNLQNVHKHLKNVSFDYSNQGLISSITTLDNGTTSYFPSSDKKTLSVTNSMNQQILYTLNDSGNISSIQNPDKKITNYKYDSKNRIVQKKWNSGMLTNYNYDDFNNSVNVQTKNQNHFSQKQIEYNVLGQVIAAKNEHSDFSFEYDLSGNLTKYSDNKAQISVFYEYDNFERLCRKKSDAFDFVYEYDFAGRVCKLEEVNSGNWVQISYDNCSNEILRKFSNGTLIQKYYDDFERLVCVICKNSLAQVIKADFISYDKNGRISGRCDEKSNVTLYEYDQNGRVICEKKSFSKELFNFYKNEAIESGLYIGVSSDDYNGNAESIDKNILNDFYASMKNANYDVNISSYQNFWNQQYEYNSIGSLTCATNVFGKILYEYDKLNRLVFKHGANSQTEGIYLSWNDDGLLTKINGLYNQTVFEYDAESRPVKIYNEDLFSNKAYTTYYTYDVFGRRYSQTDENGDTAILIYDNFSTDLLIKTPVYENNEMFISSKMVESNYNKQLEYKLATNIIDESNADVKTTGIQNSTRQLDSSAGADANFKMKSQQQRNATKQIQTENRPLICAKMNGESYFNLYSDANYYSQRELKISLPDYRKSVVGNSNIDSDLSSVIDYDCWGNPISLENGASFNNSNLILNSTLLFYDLGYRDYSPIFKCFTTEDPMQDGTNWFSYCATDPINNIDLQGFAKKELSTEEQINYSLFIMKYAKFDQVEYKKNGTNMQIPKGYDCADVATLLTILANKHIGKDSSSGLVNAFAQEHNKKVESNNFTRNSALDTIDILNDKKGDDFNQIVGGYNKKEKTDSNVKRKDVLKALKDPSNIVPGSVIAWANPNNMDGKKSGWIGHVGIVVSRKFDSEGNVIGVLTLQGHTNGTSTELEYVSFVNNSDGKYIENYKGEFYGVYEFESKKSKTSCSK